jgi:hypothetical protein
MKISKTHQEFADLLRNQRTLDHPEEFLGPNWKDVLNFWLYLDTLNEEQFDSSNKYYYSLSCDKRRPSQRLACRCAIDTIDRLAAACAGDAPWISVGSYAAGYATDELIGSHILHEQGKPLTFLSLFDYQSPFNN